MLESFGCMERINDAGAFRLYEENEEWSHPFDGFNGVKSSDLEGFERLDRLYEENEEWSHP